MSVPVLVLLGFAAWTLLTLICSIGVYRWRRILTGRASIAEWRADLPQGSDWYQRAMRAHMNCVENLPVYAAIVVALVATGQQSPVIDRLAIVILAARVAQTLVHIGLSPTNAAAGVRFALFFTQVACMFAMGAMIVAASGQRLSPVEPSDAKAISGRRPLWSSATAGPQPKYASRTSLRSASSAGVPLATTLPLDRTYP